MTVRAECHLLLELHALVLGERRLHEHAADTVLADGGFRTATFTRADLTR